MAAVKAEEEAREAELNAEAAKIDLEPYREKIMEIINRQPTIWGTVGRETLSSREIGKVVWYMINHHKGFDPKILKIALRSFIVK